MTQEQKARAYDEALNQAKFYHGNCPSEPERKKLEKMFPVLCESEDERIRKRLIEYFEGFRMGNAEVKWEGLTVQEVLAWLEKQKENTWSEEDDAKVKVMCEEGDLKPSERAWLKDLKNRVWKEQKPAEWSAKGRRGRIGSTPEHIRKKAENFLSKMEPPYDADDICSAYETGAMENANSSWSEEDEKMLRTIISDGSRGVELDSKQISWLKSLRPQSKQMISEDTEVLMTKLINLLKSYRIGEETATTLANRIADTYGTQRYMDGLCDSGKLHWKPSEEQMKALEDAFRKDGSDEYRKTINSLYQDLKKLM